MSRRIMPREKCVSVGITQVQYMIVGTNMPNGVTWSITTNGTEGEAVLSGTTTSAVVTPGTVASNYTIRASSIANTSYYDEVTLWVVGVDKLMYNRYGQAGWSNIPVPPSMMAMETGQWLRVEAFKVPTNAPWPSGKPVWTGVSNPIGDWIDFHPTTTGIYTIAAECGNAKTGLVAAVKVDITGRRPGKISSPGSDVSEADEDSPDNLFIAINDDNDDNGPSFQKDNRDDVVGTNDNDIVKLTLKIQPVINNGAVELSVSPSDSLRLFKADGQTLLTNTIVDLSSPTGDLIGLATGSVDIVVEGKDVAVGDPTNVVVKMTYKMNGQELCADEIHIHMTWIILPTVTIWNPFRFYFGNCGEDELRTACTNRGFTVTDRLATVDPGDAPNLHTIDDIFDDISGGTIGILWMDGHGNAESNVVAEIPIETYTNYATALASFNNYTNQGFSSDEIVIRAGYTPKPWAICVTTRFIENYCLMRDHSAIFLALCYGAVPGGGASSLADAFVGTNRADNSFGYDGVSFTGELISDTKAIFETVAGLKPIGGTAKNYTIKEAYDGGGIDTNQASWPAHLLRGNHRVDSVRMYIPQ